MTEILHKVGITSSPSEVYRMLTTIEGLKCWWTEHTTGHSHKGGTLHFSFPDKGPDMLVKALSEDHIVQWQCIAGPQEWIGTNISFMITENKNETLLYFSHSGFKEGADCLPFCTTKWAVYLLNLKCYLENGQKTPFPNEQKITHSEELTPEANPNSKPNPNPNLNSNPNPKEVKQSNAS